MAGESDIKMLRQLLDEGAQGFIIKPLSPKTIEKSCAEVVYQLSRRKESLNRAMTASCITMVHHFIPSKSQILISSSLTSSQNNRPHDTPLFSPSPIQQNAIHVNTARCLKKGEQPLFDRGITGVAVLPRAIFFSRRP